MKKLPFIYSPIVDAYSGVAGNVAIQLNNDAYIPLIIYNHFLISYDEIDRAAGFNWNCYCDLYGHDYDLWKDIEEISIVEALCNAIDRGHYIHAYLDHFFLSCSSCYQKYHFLHDSATIFGYDKEMKFFWAGDNFRKGKYTVEKIPMQELELAIKNNKKNEVNAFYFDEQIDFDLDNEKIVKLIKGYIDGKCYLERCNDIVVNKQRYGLDIFGIMKSECEEILLSKNLYFDGTTYQVVCNHMSIGSLLVKYVKEKKKINSKIIDNIEKTYCELYNEMLIARNMFLKGYFTIDREIIHRLIRKLNSICRKEETCLCELLALILTLNNDNQ